MFKAALSQEQMAEAVLLYEEHCWTTAEIGEHFGVSDRAIARTLVRMGVSLRHATATVLKMKQCCACLRFLPVGVFGFKAGTRTVNSRCGSCAQHRKSLPWQANSAPLTQALSTWRN